MLWRLFGAPTYICLVLFCNRVVRLESVVETRTSNEGGCTMDGIRYDVGEIWSGSMGDCKIYECIGNDGTYSKVTCEKVAVPHGSDCVVVPGHFMYPYPLCCDRLDCEN